MSSHHCVTVHLHKDYIRHCGGRGAEAEVPSVHELVGIGGDKVQR